MIAGKGSRKGLLQNLSDADVTGLKQLWHKILDLQNNLSRKTENKLETARTGTKNTWIFGWSSYLAAPPKDSTNVSSEFNHFTYDQFEEELMKNIMIDHPDNHMIRYLRARGHDASDAFTMVYNSIKFFHDHEIHNVTKRGELALSQYPLETGEMYFHGRDVDGNAVLYVRSKHHDRSKTPLDKFSKFLMYLMSQGYTLRDDSRITIITNLEGISVNNLDYKRLQFTAQVLSNNFPECLNKVFIINAPWIFTSIWSVISGYFDSKIREKFQFVKQEELVKLVDLNQLPIDFGGNKFEYSYTAPTKEETDVKFEDEEYTRLTEERKRLGRAFLDKTQEWLGGEPVDDERSELADELARNYRELSPYTWSPSIYNRQGYIKNFDDVDFSIN